MERHGYGNILKQSLEEAWYSAEHLEKLRGIEAHECAKYDCRFMRYAEVMESLLEDGNLDFI